METEKQQSLQHGYVLQGKQNRYVIDRVLGQGAFGITYLARYKASITGDMGSGAAWVQVAIKEFFMRDLNVRDGSTGYLNDSSQDSLIGRYRRAFMREARNLSGLHHDNIVNVFEVIETNNTVYIVMEYINGGSLDERIAQAGHLSQDESIDKMLQLCSAVECMHEHRMLHLDIKPKNVMLDEDGNLFLIDFGLSKQYTTDGEPESSTSIGLGTPGYSPVEQAEQRDGENTFRTTLDIYALGATLYKMLTGKTPPRASEILNDDELLPSNLQKAGVSNGLAQIIEKAMMPSSRKRFQSVPELITAIDNLHEQTLLLDTGKEPGKEPKPAPVIPVPVAPEPPVAPELPVSSEPDPSASGPSANPAPSVSSEPDSFAPKTPSGRFPKWMYTVMAAMLVGLIVFLAIPKSRAPQSVQPPVTVTDTIETPAPVAAPTPEPKPGPESKSDPKTVALTSISLSKTSLTLEEGATSTLAVRYTPSDATDKSTTWKSTDTKVATVSSSGKITAVKAGSATIIATSGSYESSCKVTVESRIIALSSISLDKTTLALEEGASSALYIEYSPSNASDKSTTWESTNTNVAIVDNNGTVTAVGAGDATIIATCGKLEKTCRVTVKAKVIPLTSISLNKTSLSLEEGSSSTLTVYYSPSNATDKSIMWKSSDPGIATVSNTGVVTAVKAGSAAIVAYSADGIDAFCNLTVTAKIRATGTVNGHEWVDLGLSVKWATCNVGASKPEGYGDYYAWGETSTKDIYRVDNYRFYNGNKTDRKYNYKDNLTTLELSDDVARQKWGGSWRMPTIEELQELLDNCTWSWTTINGVNGYKVTSKKYGYTSCSIFLPAAGQQSFVSPDYFGSYGFYRSSSRHSDASGSRYLYFTSDAQHTNYHGRRDFGWSVRPVCK